MKRTFRYRQKILLSQILLFLSIFALSIPFIEKGLISVQEHALARGATKMIKDLSSCPNEEAMISSVRSMHGDIFYKVVLYSDSASAVAISNVGILGDETLFFDKALAVVKRALQEDGVELTSFLSSDGEEFLSLAMPFVFHEKHYVLLGAFPFGPVKLFIESFNFWFIFVCFSAVIIFSVFTFMIFKRLHRPISAMVSAIEGYSAGQKDAIPKILKDVDFSDDEDLGRLSETIVSLHDKVQKQMLDLSYAKDEREAILESLCEGVIAVDASMNLAYVNFIGAKMLGVSKRGLIGKHFDEHLSQRHDVLITKCKELLLSAMSHKSVVTDSIAIENAAKVYYDLIASPTAGYGGAIVVIQDRSSQQKVLEMGKDFIANASHELRTPITIIKGFAETLQDMKEMPHDMLSSIVEKIVRNCERMENLVSNLLTLADLENLSISAYASCDIIPLVENCMEIVRAVYPDATIDLHSPRQKILITGDGSILELAIINLLTNAAKYSKGPAIIHVKLTLDADDVCITISDQGIGIPSEDLEHIFERFYTVDKAHSRKLGGAGLGLSLVKTIIEKHHGMIEVASTLGSGTTFTIHLPLARS